jgi:poly(A) polymerase/tRNA nucleotidyltransferase (CCA-adding enzyme)
MADTICRRLKLSTAERESVHALVENHMFFYAPEWTDGTVRRFVKRVGIEQLPALLALREADVTGRGMGEEREKETRELRVRVSEVAAADAALSTKDLAIDGPATSCASWRCLPGRQVGRSSRRCSSGCSTSRR